MTAVLLLGSCATRDSFELAEAKGLRIVDYFARTSLVSLATSHMKMAIPFRSRLNSSSVW